MKKLLEEKLQRLAEDEIMLEAIKVLFKEKVEAGKPLIDSGDNNSRIGEKYRAYVKAEELFDKILLAIKGYDNKNIDSDNFNKGK